MSPLAWLKPAPSLMPLRLAQLTSGAGCLAGCSVVHEEPE